MRRVSLGGEHGGLHRAFEVEGNGRSKHQLAEILGTVNMHATEFIELSLLLMQHTQHVDGERYIFASRHITERTRPLQFERTPRVASEIVFQPLHPDTRFASW